MRNDKRGIEGLPLRLMLVALLISLTLPAVLSSLGQMTSEVDGNRLAAAAEEIAHIVEEMASDGPGNVRIVRLPVDLSVDGDIMIGGSEGSVESLKLTWSSGGKEMGCRYLNDVAVITSEGVPLTLTMGATLRLSSPNDTWGEVRAEIL